MSDFFDLSYLNVMVDMAGCPNRCRHCWLGCHKNGCHSPEDLRGIAREFKSWRDERGEGIREFGFFTWWREPDYRDDYRELWELERELSSKDRALRYEVLSTWRLARDESYAGWAAAHGPRRCQITFFGMEENTDWGMRRKGGFNDQLIATERCLRAGIAPRWQLFLTKRCTGELDEFTHLISRLRLFERCADIGQEFEVFIGGISPEGSGYEIEALRVEKNDLRYIPRGLIDISRDGLKLLGRPESELCEELYDCGEPSNMDAGMHSLAVNAEYDVYPNVAEPTEWWRLGNLIRDGVDKIICAYRDQTTPGMRANRSIPLSELSRKYGDPMSEKLYARDDFITRLMHQWGAESSSLYKWGE